VTTISHELIAAYCATDYRVRLPGPVVITLRVDQYSEPLARLHDEYGVRSSAFLTAYNPYSTQASQQENIIANQALLFELAARGLPWIEGEGAEPSGDWSPEPSFLVIGAEFQAANELALQFRQNAFLFCATEAVPTLVLTR
jgi:hypothetical protein